MSDQNFFKMLEGLYSERNNRGVMVAKESYRLLTGIDISEVYYCNDENGFIVNYYTELSNVESRIIYDHNQDSTFKYSVDQNGGDEVVEIGKGFII